MGSLMNEWILLFDEQNFKGLRNEPNELRTVSMLFITIQKEFKRIEDVLSDKLQSLRSTTHQNKKIDNLVPMESSPPKENQQSASNTIEFQTKTQLKSPVFDRHRKPSFRKVKKKVLDLDPCLTSSFENLSSKSVHTPKNIFSNNKKFTDVIEEDDIFDSSVIGVTPNVNLRRKGKIKISPKSRLNSKSTWRSTTLTQMFGEMTSNETDRHQESNMMGITEIMEEVDKACKSDQPTVINVSNAVTKDSGKSRSFFQDYNIIPEVKKSPKRTFVHKETVRGSKKRKLKGWSCKNCENFYKMLNLPEEELEKKMNECSKHKSRFKPDNETIPGFWDLTIPATPEDEVTQSSTSTQESEGNNSTIFCFYK